MFRSKLFGWPPLMHSSNEVCFAWVFRSQQYCSFLFVFLDVWLVYCLYLTGKMWGKNSSWIPLVEHGASATLYFVQDITRCPPWTASFNMRTANFWSLERLFINTNKSLFRIVGREDIGGQEEWVRWVRYRSSIPRVPIRQAVIGAESFWFSPSSE